MIKVFRILKSRTEDSCVLSDLILPDAYGAGNVRQSSLLMLTIYIPVDKRASKMKRDKIFNIIAKKLLAKNKRVGVNTMQCNAMSH